MSVAAVVLAGPAVCPTLVSASNQIASQTSIDHKNVAPEKNQKGSVNCGGGGGGGGSGCGKKAACGKCSKKCKSCGGGGGGCGGSKKKPPDPQSFKVVFKDFHGKMIGKVQDVEKDNSAEKPWNSPEEADQHPQGKVEGYMFKEWSVPDTDLATVTKNLEAKAVYEKDKRDFMTDVSWGDEIKIIEDLQSAWTEQYNDCIDGCVDTIDQTSVYITGEHGVESIRSKRGEDPVAGIMTILEQHKDEVTDDLRPVFEDIKKCIMNIQSTYVFQMRMMFNMECEECKNSIDENVNELWDILASGESIVERAKEMNENFETQIYDITEDNAEAFGQFKSDLNKYIKELNTCFPSPILQQI